MILLALLWAYSFACHTLNWFELGWGLRILILTGLTAAAWLHSRRLGGMLRRIPLPLLLGALALGAGAAWLLPMPPFPAERLLEISAAGDKNPLATAGAVEVLAVRAGDQPLRELQATGAWEMGERSYLTDGRQPAVLRYQGPLTSGDLTITLRRTPSSGKALIQWDGQPQIIDLYAEYGDTLQIRLNAIQPWAQRTFTWKLLTLLLYLSDLLGLTALALLTLAWLTGRFANRQAFVRFAGLAAAAALPVILLAQAAFNIRETAAQLPTYIPQPGSTALIELRQMDASNRAYLALAEHFSGAELFTTLQTLEQSGLKAPYLLAWGRLAAVKTSSQQQPLSDLQAGALLKGNILHFPSEKENGLDYVIVLEKAGADAPLCMQKWRQVIFIGSRQTLPGCGGPP